MQGLAVSHRYHAGLGAPEACPCPRMCGAQGLPAKPPPRCFSESQPFQAAGTRRACVRRSFLPGGRAFGYTLHLSLRASPGCARDSSACEAVRGRPAAPLPQVLKRGLLFLEVLAGTSQGRTTVT